jgi:hypothetical protein
MLKYYMTRLPQVPIVVLAIGNRPRGDRREFK